MATERETLDYIIGYIGLEKWNELSGEQKKALIKYIGTALKTGKCGTFRHLVYTVLKTYYDTDFLELNNSLPDENDFPEVPEHRPRIVELKPEPRVKNKKCLTCDKIASDWKCRRLWSTKPKHEHWKKKQCDAVCGARFCCLREKGHTGRHESSIQGHTLAIWS